MKSTIFLAALLSTAALLRAAESAVEATVTGFPAGTTELLFFVDVMEAVEGPGYGDAAPVAAAAAPVAAPLPVAIPPTAGQPAVAAAAAPAAAAPAPAAPAPRRNRGPVKPAFTARGSAKPTGDSVTWSMAAPAGTNYRVRVVAIKGDGTFPVVVAGGRATGLKIDAEKTTAAKIALAAPSLTLSADNPTTVAAGSHFKLAGVVKDPGNFLGTKNRMRVWLSPGKAPAANQAGTQISTVDVETKDDEVKFAIELTAPKEQGPLFVQFGEVSPDFARPDGKQVPFIVLPDLTAGGKPVELKVGPAKVADAR